MLIHGVRRFALVMTLVLATSGAACTEAEKPQKVVTQEVDRNLTVTVTGARQAEYKGKHKLKVITRIGKKEEKPNSVAALEPLAYLSIGNGVLLRVEVAIVGQYTGDGEFTTPAGIGPKPTTGPTVPDPGGVPTANSVSAVTFMTEGPPASELRFGYLAKPCKIKLDDGATTGSADCPELVAVNGERVSLKYSWSK